MRAYIATCILVLMVLAGLTGCGGGMDDIRARMEAKAAQRKANEEAAKKKDTAKPGGQNQGPTTQVVRDEKAERRTLKAATPADQETAESTTTETAPADPAQQEVKQATNEIEHRTRMIENLNRIGAAIKAYKRDQKCYPTRAFPQLKNPPNGLSWRVGILPYLGYQDLYNKFDFSKPFDAQVNLLAAADMPIEFQDPSGKLKPGQTRILGIAGPGTVFGKFKSPQISVGKIEDEEISEASFLMAIEGPDYLATNWAEPMDIDIYLEEVFRLPNIYESGTLGLWADGRVYEIDPDLSPGKHKLLCSVYDGGKLSRPTVAHMAVPDVSVLETNGGEIEPEGQSPRTLKVTNVDPEGNPLDGEEQDSTLLISAGDNSPEALKRANRESRTSLVFETYGKYLDELRFANSWTMHLASLVIGDDSLRERFFWSPQLQRPLYGFQVGVGAVATGKFDPPVIPFDLVDTTDRDFLLDQKVYEDYGAPAAEVLAQLRNGVVEGDFGPWQQSIALEKMPSASSENKKQTTKKRKYSRIATELGDHYPGIRLYQRGMSISNLIDLAQRDDLDLLFVLQAERMPTDLKLSVTAYDVQRRKLLAESMQISTTDYIKLIQSPLKQDPMQQWQKEITQMIQKVTSREPLPEFQVEQVRNRLRDLMGQESTRISVHDFLEAKLYVELGLISGVEFQKVAAKWSDLGNQNDIYSVDTFKRLEAIESHLPKDWEKPIVELGKKQREGDDED